MAVFAVTPEENYLEDHGNGLIYAGWRNSFQSTEVEMCEFLYGLTRFYKPELIVETGTLLGRGTVALALACNENRRGRVVTCDIDSSSLDKAKQYLAGFENVEFRNCSSLDLPELGEADMIFSDSAYESRIEEFNLAKPGALYVVHDAHRPEIASIVKANGGTLLNRGRGCGIILKVSA